MVSTLWYIVTVGLSIWGAGQLMNYFSWLVSDNSPPPEIQKFSQFFIEAEQWYIERDFNIKLLIMGGMTLLALLLALSCRLDKYLRNIPGGSFLHFNIGESPLEEHWTYRLLPCMTLFVYILIRIFAMMSSPQAEFKIQTFSLIGQDYTAAQWITHITYFLILAFLIFLIFDSLLSAGLIGAILHLTAVISANITGLLVLFAIITAIFDEVNLAASIIIVVCVVIGLFTAVYRIIYNITL